MERALPLLALSALALAACGSDDDGSVTIADAWARTSAAGQTTGAIYLDLTVDRDDTLLGASVPSSVAARAEIHEVVMADTAGSDEMDEMDDAAGSDRMDEMDGMDEMDVATGGMDGAMLMQELTDGLALTAGETVSFRPGGYHVMLVDLAEPLEVGDEIELTLELAESGTTTLAVEVTDSAP